MDSSMFCFRISWLNFNNTSVIDYVIMNHKLWWMCLICNVFEKFCTHALGIPVYSRKQELHPDLRNGTSTVWGCVSALSLKCRGYASQPAKLANNDYYGRNPSDPHWPPLFFSGEGAFLPKWLLFLNWCEELFAACVVFLFFLYYDISYPNSTRVNIDSCFCRKYKDSCPKALLKRKKKRKEKEKEKTVPTRRLLLAWIKEEPDVIFVPMCVTDAPPTNRNNLRMEGGREWGKIGELNILPMGANCTAGLSICKYLPNLDFTAQRDCFLKSYMIPFSVSGSYVVLPFWMLTNVWGLTSLLISDQN